MANVLQRVEQLSPQERALLVQRLQHKKNAAAHTSAIPRQPRAEGINTFPLSFAQERMWFLDQLDGEQAIYNTASALRIEGQIDPEILARSLNEVTRRHEILRTSFAETDGQPIQIVAPGGTLPLRQLELSHVSLEQREHEIQHLIASDVKSPFNLAQGPLLRATLLRLGPEEHVFFITIHHIIADGWSYAIFIQDLMAFYESFIQGKPLAPAELPIQYADFAIWQRQNLQGKTLDDLLAYWKRQLADAPPTLELPTDHPRPPKQTFHGHAHKFTIPLPLTNALRALSQQEGVTLFMVLLAAFQSLLSRYTGQTDIVVGTPIASRNHTELERQIGFFINTLALRTNLSGEPTFRELLKRVREVALGAYAHQNLPFEALVEALHVKRNLSHTPLFQVMFIMQNAPSIDVQPTGLTITDIEVAHDVAQFDVVLSFFESARGLDGMLEYNADLFEPESIARLAGHLQTIIQGIAENPECRLSDLPMLTQAERHQILAWNRPHQALPLPAQSIHAWVEAQAHRTPNACAVICDGKTLTYDVLNRNANQLARHLQQMGVKPGTLVGLLVERSVEIVIGILGILKAGGAYVPLEPALPAERLTFILDDLAQAQPGLDTLLITQASLAVPIPNGVKPIYLDTDWPRITQHAPQNLTVSPPDPALPAYVIYTSGSTGKPKGCLVTHANVIRLFTETQAWYGFGPDDVWTLFHSYAFDFSVWELWGALFYGGRVVIVPHLVSRSPEAFYELLHREGVTVLNQTPSAFLQLIQAELSLAERKSLALRYVIFGGEALEIQRLRSWFDLHGDQHPQLINMYGITETTVHVTYRPLSRADLNRSASLIGRPIPDLQLHILDEHRQLVPVGIPGEMYVGGAGVCAGYLNRTQLTQERFVPIPDSLATGSAKGNRLYKTGDLARYTPDGDVEYLGRQDHQVKIRGFRIELGEIETVLSRHPGIRIAAVLAREDQPGHKQLVAYLVCDQNPPTINELRSLLKMHLPDYMIPSAYIFLTHLPLTANGKLDRKALPAPDHERPELAESYAAPRTPQEETLAKIWMQVLQLERVGIYDNFFTLGGDSLLCIQIVARARQAGLQFSLKQMFEHQTIADLATAIENQASQAEQGIITGRVALTPSQARFFRHDYPLPHWWNNSRLFKLKRSPGNIELLEQVMRHIISYHDALRARFHKEAGSWQQIIISPDEMPCLVSQIDLSDLPAKEREIALMTEAARLQQSLNLTEGPLVRAVQFELGENKPHYLLLIIHHLVADGASFAIIIEDIATLYQKLLLAEPAELPLKTTSTRQWAEAIQSYAQSTEFQQQLGTWLALPWQQSGPLPLDHPENKARNQIGSHDIETALFSPEETKSFLKTTPQHYGVQPFEILLAVLVQTITSWNGRDWLAIDTIDVGRMMDIPTTADMDLARTVGWLSTHHFLLLRRSASNHPGDMIQNIKKQMMALPKQGIPADIAQQCPAYAVGLQFPAWAGNLRLNYVGRGIQTGQDILQPTSLPPGATMNPDCCEAYVLGCVASIPGKRLMCAWNYSRNLYDKPTIKNLSEDFKNTLKHLLLAAPMQDAG